MEEIFQYDNAQQEFSQLSNHPEHQNIYEEIQDSLNKYVCT